MRILSIRQAPDVLRSLPLHLPEDPLSKEQAGAVIILLGVIVAQLMVLISLLWHI